MRGVRIPHDLNGEDRFILGLSVGNLAVLLFGLLGAYVVVHLSAPLPLRGAAALLLVIVTCMIVWLRPEGRSLMHWIGAAIEYSWSMRSPALAPTRAPAPGLAVVPGSTSPATADAIARGDDDDDVIDLPAVDHAPVPPAVATDGPPVPVYLGGPQVIVFYSAKGGLGRTTLATEVACLLAARGWYRDGPRGRTQRLNVLLADLDRTSANVSVRIGLVQPTLLDYLGDFSSAPEKLGEYLVRHESSNLRVLLGSPKCLAIPNGPSLGANQAWELVSALRAAGQFILIDVSASIGEFEAQILDMADRIVCVVTPTASAVQDLYRSVEVLRRLGHGAKLAYAANRIRERWDFAEPMGDLRGRIVASIPYEPGFELAENRHEPYVLRHKGPAESAVAGLANFLYPALTTSLVGGVTPGWLPWFGRRRRAG